MLRVSSKSTYLFRIISFLFRVKSFPCTEGRKIVFIQLSFELQLFILVDGMFLSMNRIQLVISVYLNRDIGNPVFLADAQLTNRMHAEEYFLD